jgi:endonuclease I
LKKNAFSKLPFILSLLLVFSFLSPVFNSTQASDGSGTWESPYSTAQSIVKQGESNKSVTGYVVGQPASSTSIMTSNYSDDYALALADSPSETNTSNMIYVQIPSDFRTSFGLKSNPDLKGEKIKMTGSLTAYFSHPGVKSVTRMEHAETTEDPIEPPADSNPEVGSYYDAAIGKTGESLKTSLHEIIDDHTELSYSAVWNALKNTDEDPANPNNVILLYSGRSQSENTNGGGADEWNREHVWAKSHGDFGTSMGPGTDIHHLRPTDVTVNSSRSNLDFDNGGIEHSEARGNYYDSDSWEPRDEVKGDVARMLFYMAVRYEGDSGELDLELNNSVNNGSNPFHGKQSVLLEWHEQDPVDSFEQRRNDLIFESYQHNRNPFIDHPEWAKEIWN